MKRVHTSDEARKVILEYIEETCYQGFDEEFPEVGRFLKRNHLLPTSKKNRKREDALATIGDMFLYLDALDE